MFLEVLSSQKTVKHDAGIREGNWLQQLRLDTPVVGCTSRPTGRAGARKISDVQSDSLKEEEKKKFKRMRQMILESIEEVHVSRISQHAFGHNPQIQLSSRIIGDTYICGHMILLLDPSAFRYMKSSPK